MEDAGIQRLHKMDSACCAYLIVINSSYIAEHVEYTTPVNKDMENIPYKLLTRLIHRLICEMLLKISSSTRILL